jgi:hypothetical protein
MMCAWSREEAITMERRHILEGEERVVRQEALVARLVEQNHETLVPVAAEILVLMHEILEFARTRLQSLEGQ